MKPDRLSYLIAAHVWMATPGVEPTRSGAGRVFGLARLVAFRVARMRERVQEQRAKGAPSWWWHHARPCGCLACSEAITAPAALS